MLIQIPNGEILNIESAVFDYNGTIATDGIIKQAVRERLEKLGKLLPVYILTADTNGNAHSECEDLPVRLSILTGGAQSTQAQKASIVSKIGANNCACFGNGQNDIEMFKIAALSVAIIGEEGVCAKLLPHSSILIKTPEDAIDLLLTPNRLKATLRN